MWIKIAIDGEGGIREESIVVGTNDSLTDADFKDSIVLNEVTIEDQCFGSVEIIEVPDEIYVSTEMIEEDTADQISKLIRIGITYYMQSTRSVEELIQMSNWLLI